MTTESVLDALKGVVDPDLRRDIVSLGFVKDLDVIVDGGRVVVRHRAGDAVGAAEREAISRSESRRRRRAARCAPTSRSP